VQDGFLDLPVIGRLEVKGQTIESLQAILRGKLKTYFRTTPLVNIRYLNFKATLLGEVTRPGVISMPNPRVTLLEALGMAGDLTPYANRRNVLLIREKDGKRTYARIDLHQDDLLSSPYYYLQQNDLIYVEPLRARTATVADRGQRVISYGTAVLSLAALVLTLTQR
ncbi:MAG: SLBB domain-containing protein, partial [Bacteroidota bacterium]